MPPKLAAPIIAVFDIVGGFGLPIEISLVEVVPVLVEALELVSMLEVFGASGGDMAVTFSFR